jgi:hypothetical protein
MVEVLEEVVSLLKEKIFLKFIGIPEILETLREREEENI